MLKNHIAAGYKEETKRGDVVSEKRNPSVLEAVVFEPDQPELLVNKRGGSNNIYT